MSSGNAALMNTSKVPSAEFKTIGDKIVGTVLADPEEMQQRDFTDGKPKTWDNGDPMMQVVITISTDLRDPEVEDDDGTRRIFAPLSNKPGSMADALRKALRAAGADGLHAGGKLAVAFTGEEPPEKKGFSPRKLYTAQYAQPSPGNDLLGSTEPAPAAPAPAAVAADDLF